MAKVSAAERWINEVCGQSFTTVPDGVFDATLFMSEWLMNKQLLQDNLQKKEYTLPNINEVIALCKDALVKNKVKPDYSSSASDFHLPTLEG